MEQYIIKRNFKTCENMSRTEKWEETLSFSLYTQEPNGKRTLIGVLFTYEDAYNFLREIKHCTDSEIVHEGFEGF